MFETLRLIQPVINTPRPTTSDEPQIITIGDQQYIIHGGTLVSLSCTVGGILRYWHLPLSSHSEGYLVDAEKFRPERRLAYSRQRPRGFINMSDFDDISPVSPTGADLSIQMLGCVKVSYFPFSDESRVCIGRKFTQIEILSALALIFRDYSVKLAVDEFASDAEIENLPKGRKERRDMWQRAADRAHGLLTERMTSSAALQLQENTPLRFVQSGKERFVFKEYGIVHAEMHEAIANIEPFELCTLAYE